MTDTLTQHIAIVKRELDNGVTERADLINTVTKWHQDCNDLEWTEKKSAMMVDVVLALIKVTENMQL